jgi:hypothetical protein
VRVEFVDRLEQISYFPVDDDDDEEESFLSTWPSRAVTFEHTRRVGVHAYTVAYWPSLPVDPLRSLFNKSKRKQEKRINENISE